MHLEADFLPYFKWYNWGSFRLIFLRDTRQYLVPFNDLSTIENLDRLYEMCDAKLVLRTVRRYLVRVRSLSLYLFPQL